MGVENGGESEHTQKSKLLLASENQCVLRKSCVWATDPQKHVSEHREQVSGASQIWNGFLPLLTFRGIMAVVCIPAKDCKYGIYTARAHLLGPCENVLARPPN